MLLAMSASTIHFLARPHVVSWLFTLAFFWVLDSTERNYFKGVGRHRQAVGLAAADADLGERPRRISAGIRAAGNLLVWIAVDVVQDEGRRGSTMSLRKIAAGEAHAGSDLGRPGVGGGEPDQSVRMEAARAHLFVSDRTAS